MWLSFQKQNLFWVWLNSWSNKYSEISGNFSDPKYIILERIATLELKKNELWDGTMLFCYKINKVKYKLKYFELSKSDAEVNYLLYLGQIISWIVLYGQLHDWDSLIPPLHPTHSKITDYFTLLYDIIGCIL